MPPGETDVIYEWAGWWRTSSSIQTYVLLPEGKRIDTQAGLVAFDSYGAPCLQSTGTANPITMDISVERVSLDECRWESLRAADEFAFRAGTSRSGTRRRRGPPPVRTPPNG